MGQMAPQRPSFRLLFQLLLVALVPVVWQPHAALGQQAAARSSQTSNWTAERNLTSPTSSFGDLVAIGATSLLEPEPQRRAQAQSNGRLWDRIAAPSGSAPEANEPRAKLDYIVEFMRNNKLTSFCDLLTGEQPEIRALVERLNSLAQFTLFVPTNEALLLMPKKQMDQIGSSPAETKHFLLAHATSELIVAGASRQTEPSGQLAYSLAGQPLHVISHQPQIPADSRRLIVNGANVLSGQSYALQEQNNTDQGNTYAIVHLIDRSLYPAPSVKLSELVRQLAPRMARYIELANDRKLNEALASSSSRPISLLMANDDALSAAPQKLLAQLDSNRTFLIDFLRGHLIEGLYFGAQLAPAASLPNEPEMTAKLQAQSQQAAKLRLSSMAGSWLEFESKRLHSRNLILVNGTPILEQDLMALNGVAHLIARPIYGPHPADDCRCGLRQEKSTTTAKQTGEWTDPAAAYEKLWPTAKPNRPRVVFSQDMASMTTTSGQPKPEPASAAARDNWLSSRASNSTGSRSSSDFRRTTTQPEVQPENPPGGNELEREESSPKQQVSASLAPDDRNQKIRAQRSGLVASNNRDFYRPSTAPANLQLTASLVERENSGAISDQPASINLDTILAAGSSERKPSSQSPFSDHKTTTTRQQLPVGVNIEQSPFEVESYKVILNATTRQRMRDQQQQALAGDRLPPLFSYDRPMATSTPLGGSGSSTTESPSSRLIYSPLANQSAAANADLPVIGTNGRQQLSLLRFQPEDARDLLPAGARNQNITWNNDREQPNYSLIGSQNQAEATNRQLMGKTAPPPGQSGFSGCAFYDADCKRLMGRLVRLPSSKTANQLQSHQQQVPIEQHLDSTFGETSGETQPAGGFTQTTPLVPGLIKLQTQHPSSIHQQQASSKLVPSSGGFNRLAPARVSALNQPLPPWSEDERLSGQPQSGSPNWRGHEKDIARIHGNHMQAAAGSKQLAAGDRLRQQTSGQTADMAQLFTSFTSGLSREPSVPQATSGGKRPPAGNLVANNNQPEQIFLTPVGVIQMSAAKQFLSGDQSPQGSGGQVANLSAHHLLRDPDKALFVSPSPILRISSPTSQQQPSTSGQRSTVSFGGQQFHTPTPYSVSPMTTHLPPIFSHQYPSAGRLTNFSAIDLPEEETSMHQPSVGSLSGGPNHRPSGKRVTGTDSGQQQRVLQAPSAHRKQRLQQLQMENNGSLGANFELNPTSGEKQGRKLIRLQPSEQASSSIRQTQDDSFGDISITSARLTGHASSSNQRPPINLISPSASLLATQASNVSTNFIRSVPLIQPPEVASSGDFFQDRTIAEIMDDSGLRIDGQQVTFSRLKECLTDADLLSLVTQTGSSLTIFMPTDSAFHSLVQQQLIMQQRDRSSRTSRLLETPRRHLLPLIARRPLGAAEGSSRRESSLLSGRLTGSGGSSTNTVDPLDIELVGGGLTTTASSAAAAADRLTLDCSSSQLRQLLLDHLSARMVTPRQLQHDLGIRSLNGHQLLMSSVPSKKIVVVDGQPVIAATRAKNGMVYVLNKFLNLTHQSPNVIDLMETQTNLTTFLSYLNYSSMSDRLRRETGPITILAPTNEAFEQLSSSARQLINSDPAALTDILRGHIVEGAQFGKLISMRSQLKTMNPDQVIEAKVMKPNVYMLDNQMTSMRLIGTTGNGVVNTIDRLIVPQWLKVGGGSSSPATGSSSANGNRPLSGSSVLVGELEPLAPSRGSPLPSSRQQSASLNLPVISSGQPVRFEQPAGTRINPPPNAGSSSLFLLPPGDATGTRLPVAASSSSAGSQPDLSGFDRSNSDADQAAPFSRNSLAQVDPGFNRNISGSSARTDPTRDTISGQVTRTQNEPQTSGLVDAQSRNKTKNMQLIEKLANLMQARKFVKYLSKSRISELLKPDMNYVILVPTDQAIEKLPKQIIDMLDRDADRLLDLVNYHVLDTTFEYINTIPDGQTLNTLNEKDILFNWHKNNTILTASGAVVMGGIQEANIALLIVDRVLYPTPGDILNIISKSPILSNFTSLVRNAGLEQQLTLAGPYTLFAPSDSAFSQLQRRDLDFLQRNKEAARRFLLRHLSQPTVFTSSIALSSSTNVTLSGQTTTTTPTMTIANSLGEDLILRQRNDYFSVNEVNFSYADVAATNGVVHVIDGLL